MKATRVDELILSQKKKSNLRGHVSDNKEKVEMAIRQWLVIQKFQNWSQNWHTIRVYFYQGDKRIPSCIP